MLFRVTLFRILLGDYKFSDLEDAFSVLGPIYFVLYVLIVFFIFLNIFLAIINNNYADTKAETLNQQTFSFFELLKSVWKLMLL